MTRQNGVQAPDRRFVYAAYSKCGCIAALHIHEIGFDPAEWFAEEIAEGREVRLIPHDQAMADWDRRQPRWGKCIHEQPIQPSLLPHAGNA